MSRATKEHNAIVERVQGLDFKSESLKDEFDLCERDLSVPRRKVRLAKISVDHAVALVNGRPKSKGELSPKDLQRIVQCVKDLSMGKRKFFMLCLNDDKSGLIDMNTEIQYFFEE